MLQHQSIPALAYMLSFNPCAAAVYKKLAERVMKGIEKEHEVEESRRTHERDQRELVWAQAKRNTVLMRHPTNWTASLFQVFGSLHTHHIMTELR